jgi:hypothetical protein
MPPAAQDQSTDQSQVRQVAGSEDAAVRLGASQDVVPQANLADPPPPEEEGGAPPQTMGSAPAGLNPDEEIEQPEPPFEATCPTCEKPLSVYVPDPSIPEANPNKVDTGFCVACGRRWTKEELEMAGALRETAPTDDAAASADGSAATDGSATAPPDGSSASPTDGGDSSKKSSGSGAKATDKDKDKASAKAP